MKAKIKKDIMVAMKNGETTKRDVLRVLMSEIERNEQGKNGKIELSKDEIVSVIKKMVTNITESTNDATEIEVLSVYLPKMLNEGDINQIINETIERYSIDSMKGMGLIMKEFSTNYPNMYDGRVVSSKIKEILA